MVILAFFYLFNLYNNYKTQPISPSPHVEQKKETRAWETLSNQEKEYIAKGLKTSVDNIDNQITRCLALIALGKDLHDKTKQDITKIQMCEKFLNKLGVVYH